MAHCEETLRAAFASMDSNQDGKISFEEMKKVTSEECTKRGLDLTEEWFEEIFKDLDINGDGEIGFAEFVAAVPRIPEVSQGFAKPKVVEKVFDLPVVSDTYDSLVKLSSPLSPYVEKIGTLASPVVDQALEFRARIEDKVPEGVQTGYTTTLNKVVTAAVSLDATLCSGVDTLVEKVPALKLATPTLYNSTRESVGSYATLVATYVASFTIAQVFLKAADLGLETTEGLLKLTANEKVDPILRGMRRVRSEASSLRKEGIVLNGTVKAKTIEEATLIGAMLEIFGLGSFFNQPGNSRDGAEEASLPEDEDAIDIVAMLPSKTRSGLVL